MEWGEVLLEIDDARRPRDPKASRLVQRAVRRYRATQVLAAVPLLMAASLRVEGGPRAGTIAFAVFGAMAAAVAVFGESNIRAIRRLYRDGFVVWGAVVGSRRVRGGHNVAFVFDRDGRRRRVAVTLDAEFLPRAPILVVPHEALVLVVTGDGGVIGRSTRA